MGTVCSVPFSTMSRKKLLECQKLFLILTVLSCCRSLEVTIPQAEYEVASGGDVTMTCSFDPARPVTNNFVLTWEAYPDATESTMKLVATYFLNNPIDIAPTYEGKATMEVDMDRQESRLTLSKVTVQDSRRFQCSVMIPNDDEGTTAATTSLLVLVPPSQPVCEILGTAEYWQNITMTCVSEGSPKPVSEWKSYSIENIPRPFPPRTVQKDGSVSLFNISREMSGFYVCTATNRIGSASCNLTLSVMPPSMNIGSTAGIIVGVLAAVVILGILVFCCCRKKDKKGKTPEGPPGDVYYDRNAPEVGEQYLDDKSNAETKQSGRNEDNDTVPRAFSSEGTAGRKLEDDQHSYTSSSKERYDGKGSDADSRRNQRDRLDDQRDRHGGSRDRLDDTRDRHGGSRDRLDDTHDRYGGSRDRLDDTRDRHGGSRDRLDDTRDRHGGSRDRLDDTRDRHGGSRDRLDDTRDRHSGSRDRLNDNSDHYRRSRDRLDYVDDRHRN
ncbi:cell surface A33 antigen-like [Brachionichthys hirsutus]|uniref:cell surface A33 antigen-like n=1 Tax=Brachionichthys hirsutus TaxID=412623 RepID=UPI0036046F0E